MKGKGVMDKFMESIKNAKPLPLSDSSRLQIFRTRMFGDDIELTKELHFEEILLAIVKGKSCEINPGNCWDEPLHYFSGFEETKGRSPNLDDEIEVFHGRLFVDISEEFIMSEIIYKIREDENKAL